MCMAAIGVSLENMINIAGEPMVSVCFSKFLWSDSIMNGRHESSYGVLCKQMLKGIVVEVGDFCLVDG